MAVAYGLARRGRAVTLLDEGDASRPASSGNFGLVWLQSKGEGYPAYAAWTARSVKLWPEFARNLATASGLDVGFRQPGGLHLCLGEASFEKRRRFIERMSNQMGAAGYRARMLDRAETRALAPAIGDKVTGASYCPLDGHANPLLLLRALLIAAKSLGLEHWPHSPLRDIAPSATGYRLELGDGRRLIADRLILAAGLGNAALMERLGERLPLRPQRGQILVTRRLRRFLNLPTTYVRQTEEGSVLLGDSKEEVGFDYGTSIEVGAQIAKRAIESFPVLAEAQVVRTWGALRVLSPDGFPIYQNWAGLPGLTSLNCHSGVTLAAAHAEVLAATLEQDGGTFAEELAPFTLERFDVQAAAAV
jgi:glycine/D-amino acid oxidase-like deaminating enzyme